MKKIYLIQGHPNKASYVRDLAETYQQAAVQAGHEVRMTHLADMDAKFVNWKGYGEKDNSIEPDIQKAHEDIAWAEHIVICYPLWWASPPALLKAFFERTLMPGFAFRYRDKGFPEKLLKGRSARLIVTMDTPPLFFGPLVGHKIIKKRILGFCGIGPVKATNMGPIRNSTEESRKKWLKKVKELGTTGA